jgi:SPP1 family predicted phage head-tail adaptor
MSLAAGDLRHAVTVERPVKTQDSETGEQVVTWVPFFEDLPCSIKPLSVKDFLQSGAVQSNISVRITIRYIAGLTKDMRFVGKSGPYIGEIFNPAGFFNDDESGMEYITAPCSTGVNAGDV